MTNGSAVRHVTGGGGAADKNAPRLVDLAPRGDVLGGADPHRPGSPRTTQASAWRATDDRGRSDDEEVLDLL